jgi:hypothetical protein
VQEAKVAVSERSHSIPLATRNRATVTGIHEKKAETEEEEEEAGQCGRGLSQ